MPVNAFVEATHTSTPARVKSQRPAIRAIEEPGTLTIQKTFPPCSFTIFKESTVSAVSHDCDTKMKSVVEVMNFFWYLNSAEITTSVGILASSSR